MITLILLVALLKTTAAKNTNDISILGFSNIAPCAKNVRGIRWVVIPREVSDEQHKCDSISLNHRNDFLYPVQQISRSVLQNLTGSFQNPVLVCVGLSQRLWPKLRWIVDGNITNISQLSGQQYFFDNLGTIKLRITINYVHVIGRNPKSVYECDIDGDETCRRNNHPAKFVENIVFAQNKINGSRYFLPKGRCKNISGPFFGLKTDENGKIYVPESFNFSLRENIETQLTQYLAFKLYSSASRCYKKLKEFVFQYIFPSCSVNDSRIIRPCKEQCSKIQMIYCADNWKNFQEDLRYFLRKEFSVDWLGCDNLPSIRDGDECWASIYKKPYDPTKLSRSCYHESDRHYVGRINRTQSNVSCQRWDSLCPHFHEHWPEHYPELNNSENFCRNPGGEKSKPWCYTTNKSEFWNYCSVPICSTLPAVSAVVVINVGGPGSVTKSRTTSAIVVVLGFFGCFVCVSVCYFYYRARFKSSSTKSSTNVDVDQSSVDGETVVIKDDDDDDDDSIYETTGDLTLKKLEIPRKNFICRRLLAKNFSHIVFESVFANSIVAVKSLFSMASSTAIGNLRREALALMDFDHENVVKLLAVCFMSHPPCLVFEFMEFGDLKHFLRRCSSDTDVVDNDDETQYCHRPTIETNLTESDLWSMAVQVAKGMDHVSSQGYVHRDLAARNCLVGAGMKVKISDFEMCRRISDAPFFVGTFDEPVGVRWASPEIHRLRLFSTFSDVWAFGVLLWEMSTFGMQPYFGMSNGEVARFVSDGNVLTKPDAASDDLFALMMRCWDYEPEKRPTFANISHFLFNELC